MKNFFRLLGIIAIAAVIGFSMIACDNLGGDNSSGDNENPDGNNSGPKSYKFIATATGENLNKQILSFDITEKEAAARSARAAIPEGRTHAYNLSLGDITISEGDLTIGEDGVYTFTPKGGGDEFSYNDRADEGTDPFTGSIPLSQAVKDAIIEAAGGLEIQLPDSLKIEGVSELRSASGASGGYWDGTWNRVDGDWNNINPVPKHFVFQNNIYELFVNEESVEMGTFLYTVYNADDPNSDPDSLFIFSRPEGCSPRVAAYFFEDGNYEDHPPNLSFYNWYWDSMEITPWYNDSVEDGGDGLSEVWFVKQDK